MAAYIATANTINVGVTITALTNFSLTLTRETQDITTQGTGSYWREKQRGLKSAEFSCTVFYDTTDATHSAATSGLLFDLTSDTTDQACTFTFQGGTDKKHTFDGIVTSVRMVSNIGEMQVMEVTGVASGAVSLDQAVS